MTESPPWRARWLLMVMLVYAAPVAIALRPITDPDVWWHLRTGEWIVQHGAVPWIDPFSAYGAGRPWVAYSWLFEVTLHALYRAFGLVGPLVYSTTLALAVTLLLHGLVTRYESRVTRAGALVAVGITAMGTSFAPRSYLMSILLFLAVFHLLLLARESRRTAHLILIPPLFAVWANLHIQFAYGFVMLAICAAESAAARWVQADALDKAAAVPLPVIVGVGVASALATLATPYHLHLYRSIVEYAGHTGVFDWVIELRAMDFRQPANWLVLGLALAAAYALGRQERIEVFPTLLFIAAVLVSFRARRDVWLVVIVSLAIVARGTGTGPGPRTWLTWPRAGAVAASVALAAAVVTTVRDVSPRGLHAAIARTYPAAAADVVAARNLPGPLFNPFDWGGYLIWRLPQLPVSMDGRTNLHGDSRILRSTRTWLGAPTWRSDPELAAANLVIGPADIALTSILRLDRRFTVLYEDDVAAVFVRLPSVGLDAGGR